MSQINNKFYTKTQFGKKITSENNNTLSYRISREILTESISEKVIKSFISDINILKTDKIDLIYTNH